MPAPTQFGGAERRPVLRRLHLAGGARQGYPIWSDTRCKDLFLCPNSATPGNPPQLCGATEPNGEVANDEESETATLGVPTPGQNQQ